jgi:hypothetical protein
MANFNVQVLLQPVTAAQFRQTLVNNLKTLGVPADQWISGSVASTLLTVVSMALALTSSLLAQTINGFFLPTATGATLQLLAFYVYGVTPPVATFASGNLTLTNTGGGVYAQGAGTYTVQNPATGQTYVNSQAFTLGAVGSSTAILTVPFSAVNSGSIGNAAPGTITTQVTSLNGVTVTNPAALVGLDPLSDAALRALCLNSLGVRSVRGPRNAYGYAVQTAVNSVTGAPVNVNRYSISESSHTGIVTIYLASPAGGVTPTDILGVAANIQLLVRPAGVTVAVLSAQPVAYSTTLTVWCVTPQGVSATAVSSAVASQLTTFFAGLNIGGNIAADDANPSGNFQGILGSSVVAAIGQGAATLGVTITGVQGLIDQALTSTQVSSDSVTLSIRAFTQTGGAA